MLNCQKQYRIFFFCDFIRNTNQICSTQCWGHILIFSRFHFRVCLHIDLSSKRTPFSWFHAHLWTCTPIENFYSSALWNNFQIFNNSKSYKNHSVKLSCLFWSNWWVIILLCYEIKSLLLCIWHWLQTNPSGWIVMSFCPLLMTVCYCTMMLLGGEKIQVQRIFRFTHFIDEFYTRFWLHM